MTREQARALAQDILTYIPDLHRVKTVTVSTTAEDDYFRVRIDKVPQRVSGGGASGFMYVLPIQELLVGG